jgi:hypothetical protein
MIQLILKSTIAIFFLSSTVNLMFINLHPNEEITSNCRLPKLNDRPKSNYQVKDTFDYVNTIVANKKKYVGQYMYVLLNDLNINVKSYNLIRPFKKYYCSGITLDFYDDNTVRTMLFQNKKVPGINIIWDKLSLSKDHDELMKKSKGEWNENVASFYGYFIIKDIATTKYH